MGVDQLATQWLILQPPYSQEDGATFAELAAQKDWHPRTSGEMPLSSGFLNYLSTGRSHDLHKRKLK